MLDLSKYADNKDSYIVNLEIDKLFDKFKVTYASGKVEENDFSIHNYQVYVLRMEEQFKLYKDNFMRDVEKKYVKKIGEVIIQNIIVIAGIIFQTSLDIHYGFKILVGLLGILFILYNIYRLIMYKGVSLKEETDKLALIDLAIKHKEDVALDVIDPVTGNNEKWYMVDVNNVDQFASVPEFAMYTVPFSRPEIKDEMSKDMTQAFKDAYTLKKRKNS